MGEGKPHPRAYGAFARKLRLYVRERAGDRHGRSAIRSMTSLPAEVFGMKDRGVLRAGACGGPPGLRSRTVGDAATYADPHQLSVGIDTVFVNGHPARLTGEFSSKLAGRVVTIER